MTGQVFVKGSWRDSPRCCTCCADAIPICIRLLNNKAFQPGPFYLGTAGIIIGWIAVGWVTFITAVFVMPTIFPVTRGEPHLLQSSAQSMAEDRLHACPVTGASLPVDQNTVWPLSCYLWRLNDVAITLHQYLCAFVCVSLASIMQIPLPHAAAMAAPAQKDRLGVTCLS